MVVIVGLGLIGGSLALGWRQAGLFRRIFALEQSRAAIDEARQSRAIDGGSTVPGPWLAEAEALVLATPAGTILPMLERCLPYLSPACRVTDVGSVKQPVVAGAGQLGGGLHKGQGPHEGSGSRQGQRLHFLGGHPMAGSERSGFGAARADLFRGATYVLTPTAETDPVDLAYWRSAATAVGANVKLMDAREHDETVAWTSHLPFIAAAALVRSGAVAAANRPHFAELVAGGFRDTTRVASGDPSMGTDMCTLNRAAVLQALQGFRGALTELEDLLRQGPAGQDRLRGELSEIKAWRDRLFGGA